jgi:hypothetical protein
LALPALKKGKNSSAYFGKAQIWRKNLTDPIADLKKNLLSVLVFWIRIRIDFGWLDPDPGGQKRPTKMDKRKK